MLYYQNGMRNDTETAKSGADILTNISGTKVNGIHNNTDGLLGDIAEYFPNSYETKDVLNAKIYEKIAKNGDDKKLIILHSAGNEDAYKALKILKLDNRNLGNKLDFISVGSPRSKMDLAEASNDVNAKLIGQYNNWLDPVTHSKTWITGAVGLGLTGAVAGTYFGASAASAGSVAIERDFDAIIFGAAGGIAGKLSVQLTHPIEKYINSDYQGLKSDLKNWAKENPAQ